MSKHTPGPWFVNGDGKDYVILVVGGLGPVKQAIATLDHCSVAINLANATLIAAAPKMLAMLKEALDEIVGPGLNQCDLVRRMEMLISEVESHD